MTGKEIIKAEIERLRKREEEYIDNDGLYIHAAEGAIDMADDIIKFINSLPEEPVNTSIDFEQELYKHFGQVKDFTLGMRIARYFYEMGRSSLVKQEEPVSEDFEAALAEEWKGYVDRGAATVDALEDNTQELAFAKGFYRGSKWQKQQTINKACEWLHRNVDTSCWLMRFRKLLEEDRV